MLEGYLRSFPRMGKSKSPPLRQAQGKLCRTRRDKGVARLK
jgi:hypothetical protein